TGLVFGPWLGALYAFVGALTSAAAGFAVGRWLGRDALARLSRRLPRLDKLLAARGVTAAFLIRKIPAPFTLINMVVGASRMRFVDFMLGSLLGLSAMVISLAMFGPHVLEAVRHPSPRTWFAAGVLLVLLAVAVGVDRVLRRRRSETEAAA
ncbi:MAG TPA: VTT domain-containing protein, partial [Planctomycetota bacterium]|nr:VTT domain-containing protein [Planctomycetota bacterium]